MRFFPSPEFIQQCHSTPVDAQLKLFPCYPSPSPSPAAAAHPRNPPQEQPGPHGEQTAAPEEGSG